MNAWASQGASSRLKGRLVLVAVMCLLCGRGMAQAGGGDYTTDLPSVARVEAEIQGKDATDSRARQVAVFNYLVSYIDRTKYSRTVTGPFTPGEQKLFDAYRLAAYQLSQDYAKAHTADEAKAFEQLHGRYEMDDAFYKDWSKRLIGPQAAAAYSAAESSLAATQRAHVAQEQAQYQKDVAAQQAESSGLSSDPTAIATRRCLELGGDSLACVGKGFAKGLVDMVTGGEGLDALTGPGRAGVVLIGAYRSSGSLPTVNFNSANASIVNCGKLADDNRGYTIRKSGAATQVVLNNTSGQIALTMRSDGMLVGPGLVNVHGQIIKGYEVVTHYVNGVAQGSTRTPVYEPADARCTIATLTPPAPAPPAAAAPAADGGLLGGMINMMGTIAPPDVAGLRILGKYFGSSGLILDFDGNSVTLDCGQAHVKAQYTVVNGPASFTVNVQNGGGPFALTVASDNSLRGAGSVTVNGRLVTGMNGDNVTFKPRTESCAVATLTPQSGDSSSTVAGGVGASVAAVAAPLAPASTAPAAAAAAAGAGMTIVISSSFPIAKNPLAGQNVALMSERYDTALRKVGAPITADLTPGKALVAYIANCGPPKSCPPLSTAMHPYFVGKGTFDNNGTVTVTAPVPAGTYYVLCTAAGTKGVLVWDLPVTLTSAHNALTLTATNAELVMTAAQ
ncbi:MAG TPA: hypothetical protein VGN01_04330 [Acidobacteriaceae bacterium]|jgi:hypothetical protein